MRRDSWSWTDEIGADVEIVVMNTILRLSGAVERDPAIDIWLNSQPDDLRSIARK
jgi:hypothetical protein